MPDNNYLEKAWAIAGFMVGSFFLTQMMNLFLIGMQFRMFSEKWWALYFLSCMMVFVVMEYHKNKPISS